ncbi:MAG: lipopolysaccharide biosynthesis protein RfbH [Lentisphaerae bacterium]|nr:lipopolysaccharide biosynthesis protein RfbH [Lentisphaerota bacterium]
MESVREKLHKEILDKVEEYYRLVHAPAQNQAFRPGETRLNYAGRIYDQEEMRNLTDAALEFWLSAGRYSRRFESEFAAFLGIRHALLVNSGSSANLLAFMTLTSPLLGERRIQRGDEVISVAAAFPTTVAPIIQYGAVPVFIDVEAESANVDVELLEQALSAKSKAVMLAHSLGNPFDARAVKEFCEKNRLWLIEDNCDALGARFAGRFCGTWGDIASSSFYPPHHITTGEGGAVYSSDSLLHKIAQSLRDWGRDCHCESGEDNSCGRRFSGQYGGLPPGYDHKYVYSHFGYNLRPTDLQAAIGCAQLKKLPELIAGRQKNYRFLHKQLCDLPELRICSAHPEAEASWFGFLLTVSEKAGFSRNELARHLESENIQTRNLFAGNLTKQPCFDTLREGCDYRIASSLDNSDRLMNQALWVGLYPGLSEEKLAFIAGKIRDFCRPHLAY